MSCDDCSDESPNETPEQKHLMTGLADPKRGPTTMFDGPSDASVRRVVRRFLLRFYKSAPTGRPTRGPRSLWTSMNILTFSNRKTQTKPSKSEKPSSTKKPTSCSTSAPRICSFGKYIYVSAMLKAALNGAPSAPTSGLTSSPTTLSILSTVSAFSANMACNTPYQ